MSTPQRHNVKTDKLQENNCRVQIHWI